MERAAPQDMDTDTEVRHFIHADVPLIIPVNILPFVGLDFSLMFSCFDDLPRRCITIPVLLRLSLGKLLQCYRRSTNSVGRSCLEAQLSAKAVGAQPPPSIAALRFCKRMACIRNMPSELGLRASYHLGRLILTPSPEAGTKL